MMRMNKQLTAVVAFLGLALTSVAAIADEHPFTEGQVVNVAGIRTEYGKFDEYMNYLATTWKGFAGSRQESGLYHRLQSDQC